MCELYYLVRLETVFELLEKKIHAKKCETMEGLINEGGRRA
jgi:ferritin-like metal-binding protein YciE